MSLKKPECEICACPYDLEEQVPNVLQCGHTFCKRCITRDSERRGHVQCHIDRSKEHRDVAQLPRNFALVDGFKLELAAIALNQGVDVGGMLWLDERDLQLTERSLGSGATCSVVEGCYQDKPVAVKKIRLGDAPVVLQTLQREAAVVLAVSGDCHHTCQYKGATIKNGYFCLVMRKYDKSLADVIQKHNPGGLPIDRVVRYATQILSGLVELHARNITVMDLKPHNLLLDADLDELVITDFGLSKVIDTDFQQTVARGTPAYMSPEQIINQGITTATDMWSWAATVLHMALGEPPHFVERLVQNGMQVVLQREAPAVPDHLPALLKDLLTRSMSFQCTQRPTAAEALHALRNCADHQQPAQALDTTTSVEFLLLAGKAELLGGKEDDLLADTADNPGQHALLSWQPDTDHGSWRGIKWHVGSQELSHILIHSPDDAELFDDQGDLVSNGTLDWDCGEGRFYSRHTLGGQLPSAWWRLTSLVSLQVVAQGAHGVLPPAWSTLTALTSLQVSANRLSGTLPSQWSTLTKLKFLGLQQNRFTGGLPNDWKSLTGLTVLKLRENLLSGCLPEAWSSLHLLRELDISSNELEGPLPSSWCSLSCLEILDLSNNQLQGSLPAAWSQLGHLTKLNMEFNKLTGLLPPEWSQISYLKYLNMQANELNGLLPAAWGQLSQLEFCCLGANMLGGPLPTGWCQLSRLRTLALHSNKFIGCLPESWGHLNHLEFLYLNSNQLNGPLPAAWVQLSNIKSLSLCNNALDGPLPDAWGQLRCMECLYMRSNKLTGHLPVSWSQLTSLRALSMHDNKLNGPLPSAWCQLSSLDSLDLRENQLAGPLPDAWSRLTNLRTLDLGGNLIVGPRPESWRELRIIKLHI